MERRRECSECVEILLIKQTLDNIERRFESIERKLQEAENYMDSISERLSEFEKKSIILEQRLDRLLDKMSGVSGQIETMGNKVVVLENRVEKIELDDEKIVYMDFLKNLKRMFDSAFIKIGVWALIVFGGIGIGFVILTALGKLINFGK